jgi:protein N-lysine methyltransferase METTL21A|mmetsp:Transcript_6521/g.23664  ORF Transcript_6521/g.23664 Transcript_6521/m.23664 type:complete len:243 (-) Transcript_6521:68-796(-)
MDDSCGRGCGVDDDDAATSTVTVTTSFDVRKGVDRSAATVTFEDDARDVRVCVRQNRDGDIEVDPTARWVWDCAPKTCEHLCARAEELVRGKRVVEIGAGTGLPGLVCAQLGATSCTLTDLPSELKLLEENVASNDTRSCAVDVDALAWGNLSERFQRERFDLCVCSDVLYHQPLDVFRKLADTLKAVVKKPGGTLVFAYYFRENLIHDAHFFEYLDEAFEEKTRVEFADCPDIWLFELVLR